MAEQFLNAYIAPNLSVPGSNAHLVDFVVTLWIAPLILVARVLAERTILPLVRAMLGKGKEKAAFQLFDNSWIALFSGALTGFAWYVTLKENGGCTPWATHDCFARWPDHPIHLLQRWYMLLSFAYYLHEIIGTYLSLGTRLKADMMGHHIVTMALTVIAYEVNLVRMSVMWQALFDVSNPILHMAKGLHAAGMSWLGPIKWIMFNLFALTFLVCRVLAGPYSILYPSFTTAVEVLPMSYCYTCWGLMLFVYALQLFWFYKIVQIALKGDSEADKAANKTD